MSDWYFYQDHGRTVGPFNLDDLRTHIRDGRVRISDLIYREGENNWRLALEHSTLRGEFKAATLTGLRERPWVCLQRKAADKDGFLTTGPFTLEEIRTRLQGGEVSYSDYAWKDGFYEWKRIGALEEFNPRARVAAVPPVPPVPQDSSTDLLKNVVELRRNKVNEDAPIPREAEGPNLAQDPMPEMERPELAETVIRVSPLSNSLSGPQVSPTPAPAPAPQTNTGRIRVHATPQGVEVVAPKVRRRRKESKLWVDAAMMGALVVTLAAAVFFISRYIRQKSLSVATSPAVNPVEIAPPTPPSTPAAAVESAPTPEVPEATDLAANEADADKDEDTEAAEKPAPKAAAPKEAPHKEPKRLFVAVQPEGNRARIEIRSDGSPDVPVFVQIVGLPGQVSEGGAFYRFLRYGSTGDSNKPIDLSKLKLPQGRFILRAETGAVKKEAKFSVGVQDPNYKASVARQRKLWAHALWKERLILFNLTQVLEGQLAHVIVGKGKKFSAKGLDALLAFKRSNAAGRLWFEDWWELHQIAESAAKNGATEAVLARAQKERDRIAVLSVWK